MPAVLQFNKDAISERFDAAAAYLGIEGGFGGFCEYVDSLNQSLAIPKTLTELGVTNPDIDRLVNDALADPSTGGNPVTMNAENTRALIKACL
jgi:4-hydroxybutyrate dehydrogenase